MTDDPYVCPICGKPYVVPSLTQDCVRRHESS